MLTEFKTLYDLFDAIPDEQTAVGHFRAIRWKNGRFCPLCGSTKVYDFSDYRVHKCGDCRARFSIKVGTVFEDTKIPVRKWLAAVWLITSHRKGIASTQLARDIGVTQKTAWFMLHRLRHAARTRSFNRPMKGDVEVDEAFFGGKDKNKHAHKRGKDDKVVVIGLLERGSELRARPLKGGLREAKSEVVAHVEPGTNVRPMRPRSTAGYRAVLAITPSTMARASTSKTSSTTSTDRGRVVALEAAGLRHPSFCERQAFAPLCR
jgi:transposase-like protein